VTLVAVSTVFIVSYLPRIVYTVVYNVFIDATFFVNISKYFNRFAVFVIYINYTANPLIYYRTVKSFTVFVDGMISRLWRRNVVAAVEPPITLEVIANNQAQ
jgi:hypothetical protein